MYPTRIWRVAVTCRASMRSTGTPPYPAWSAAASHVMPATYASRKTVHLAAR